MRESWNNSFFIARTLRKQRAQAQLVTDATTQLTNSGGHSIVRIATVSIALAMIVNIITIAVVDGFQQEVSRKVIGFGSHISIHKDGELSVMETAPLRTNEEFRKLIVNTEGVKSVHSVAYKPALLRSSSRADQKEILGVMLKGVDKSYDWDFFKTYLKEGKIPDFKDMNSIEMMVSSRVARDMNYKLGDTITAFFVKQQPIQRQFHIVGIYETGLEDLDKKMVYCSLRQVQDLNDWGIKAEITIEDTLNQGNLIMHAEVSGGNGHFRYDWGDGFDQYSRVAICPTKDTTIRLIAADYWNFMDEPVGSLDNKSGETTIADTAYLEIKVSGDKTSACFYKFDENGYVVRKYLDNTGYLFSINAGRKTLRFNSFPGKSSCDNYIGSYEVMVESFDELEPLTNKLIRTVGLLPQFKQQVQVKNIRENQQDLFVWLDFLDLNMIIVIVLMLLIGIINMGSALLVMILVRTNFIGIMKSMGASNKQIRRIFLIHMGKLMFRGMLYGNVIGFGLCWLQDTFAIMPLDAKVYYLNAVPVAYNWVLFIALNVGTMLVCLTCLLLPSMLISRIAPAKAIRFS